MKWRIKMRAKLKSMTERRRKKINPIYLKHRQSSFNNGHKPIKITFHHCKIIHILLTKKG